MPASSKIIGKQRKVDAETEIKSKQQEVRYDLRDFTIGYIVEKFKEDFFYVPEYQRKFIWNARHKCRFIESVLLGLPIPMMFVADIGEVDDGRVVEHRAVTFGNLVECGGEFGDLLEVQLADDAAGVVGGVKALGRCAVTDSVNAGLVFK